MGLPGKPDQLTDVQAYQLSLDMGVSYTAAINRLVSLRKITTVLAEQLRKPPRTIKARIAGAPIDNSWADVWPLDEKNTGKRLNLRVYDELSISLRETPSTGYVWTFDDTVVTDVSNHHGLASQQRSLFAVSEEETSQADSSAPLGLVSSDFELNTAPEGQARIGASGNRYIRLRSLRPGRFTLRLLKRRPWQPAVPPAEVFEVHLNVAEKAHGVSVQQQHGLPVAA
jgi:predicted secreted protein